MTALLLALAMGSGRPPVVFAPEPEAPNVTVQALVRLPKMGDAQRLCVKVAWDSILEGSEEYSRVTLRNYSQQTGKPLLALELGDHLLLRLTFPKNQLGTAMAMAESILRRPLLLSESLEAAISRAFTPSTDPWFTALHPEGWSEAKPSRDEIVAEYRRLVRPENVVLSIGGGFEPAAAQKELARFDGWTPSGAGRPVREWAAAARPLLKVSGEATLFELAGPDRPANRASAASDLMAAVALGVGRGSTLYRVAREANGWSYRQEGFWQPTPGGWRLRMILARRSAEDAPAFLTEWREAMQADVKEWTQADRSRAVGVLRGWLEKGIGIAPVLLLPEGRPVASLEERTHLRAWWRMKFGEELDAESVVRQAEQVKLDDLKASALEMLEKANGRFLIGSP